MKNKIHEAFERIQAEEELKKKTLIALKLQAEKRAYRQKAPGKRIGIVLASLVMLFAAGSLSYSYLLTPRTHIDLDVNPSITISLNALGQVVDSNAYNEEGSEILRETKIWYKSYEKALSALLDTMAEHGYLREDGLVSITVQGQDSQKEASVVQQLQYTVPEMLVSHHAAASSTEIYPVSHQLRSQAQAHHLSPAKYLAALELIEADPTLTFESCAAHSISEMREQTHYHNSNNSNRTDGNGRGGHHQDH